MFSPIIALLTESIPSSVPARALIRNADLDAAATAQAPAEAMESQDQRQLFIGHWDLAGTKTVEGQVLPYYGRMHNVWTLDKAWLLIQFKESQPAEGKPFEEDQYWGFSQETGINTRPMMTSTNGFALVTSTGWQGDTMSWSGTYTIGGVTLDLTETITLLDFNKSRWLGEMFFQGQSVGGYDLIATRTAHDQ